MTDAERIATYYRQNGTDRLTAAQRRRVRHKANRAVRLTHNASERAA
jgi:hypothetical protein